MDAYASIGMPLGYSHWSFGKQFVEVERNYQRGADGAGLRDRHQLESLHQLSDGREQHDHAGAGDCARLLWPQFLFQRQLSVPHLDRCGRHHRLPAVCAELHPQLRRTARGARGREDARLLPCTDELRCGSLQAPVSDFGGRREAASGRSAPSTCSAPSTISGARCPSARKMDRGRRPRASPGASGESALFRGEERASAGTLAAGDRPHRAQDRPVLLSPATDPGDERRLGLLLALHLAESTLR